LVSAFEPGHKVVAILNSRSGWNDGSACEKHLERVMRNAGVPLEVLRVRRLADIPALIRKACSSNVSAVIAGGGDGTLNAVALGLRGSTIPMAIVPIGTLNHLARDLSVPIDASKAIDALPGSVETSIDLGEVNGRVFLNNTILGLYPAYRFARLSREKFGFHKFRAMLSAVWTIFWRNPVLNLRLTVDGRDIDRRTPYVLIANNEHKMEGYQLGKRERLDAGALWVYVLLRPLPQAR
jgi:diacylglycerol kinase family enzyme